MSQDPNNIGLLPPPPLLPTQPLPLPVSQYSTQTHYPPPLPPPPLQPVYGMQYPATNMQANVPGYLNPYQQSVQGISTQAHYNTTPAAAALNPVNQAQAIYAAASQMMIGNMMMDHLSSNKRRKKRSGSPKRRMRSRSESPQRNKRARDGKRRRNRSPNHKRSYNRGSISPQKPQKREEKKSEETKKEEKKKEEKDENLYQPPTPEENVVAADTETENDVPDGNKTPDYKANDGTPKTPEYDANTGSAVTPPNSTSLTSSSHDMTSSTSVNLPDSISSPHSTKTVASVKPTLSLSPKMISLKKIRDTPDLSSPAPDVGVKSLAEILREQALKSMKRKPTPERESESERNTREATPEPDNLRTCAESPTLDRSTTETAKLARPFDDIDRNMFKPENSFDSDDDFYSDDEFDPKKYERNSEDELLASPERKNDLTGITMNFTVTPKMTKDEKRKAKLEKKRAKELKKRKKEDKKLKKLAKKQNQADDLAIEMSPNNSDKVVPAWQRKMISSHLTGDNTPTTISPNSTPPSTPDNDEAEFLKTPEKCDQIFFEAAPTPTTEEPRPKKKAKRKVVVINKDPTSSTPQFEIPEPKPEVNLSLPSAKKPLSAVCGATIRSLVPFKAEQINTVSTTANRQVKGFNPFAPGSSHPTLPKPSPPPVVPSTPHSVRSLNHPLTKPDTTRKVPPESKHVRRLGGVKTIKIKKTVPTSVAVPEQRVIPMKPAVKPSPAPMDEDLDDIDKELDLLNAALDVEPATFRSNTKADTLDDDDDLFADIEQFLNEERRNL